MFSQIHIPEYMFPEHISLYNTASYEYGGTYIPDIYMLVCEGGSLKAPLPAVEAIVDHSAGKVYILNIPEVWT